jgi:hypothetical protein
MSVAIDLRIACGEQVVRLSVCTLYDDEGMPELQFISSMEAKDESDDVEVEVNIPTSQLDNFIGPLRGMLDAVEREIRDQRLRRAIRDAGCER